MNPIPDRRQWRPMNRHRTDGIFWAEKLTVTNAGPNLWPAQTRACRLPGGGNDGTVVVRRMAVDVSAAGQQQACRRSSIRSRLEQVFHQVLGKAVGQPDHLAKYAERP